jgi:hypothetical protein
MVERKVRVEGPTISSLTGEWLQLENRIRRFNLRAGVGIRSGFGVRRGRAKVDVTGG